MGLGVGRWTTGTLLPIRTHPDVTWPPGSPDIARESTTEPAEVPTTISASRGSRTVASASAASNPT
jgi:hypothetical protein